MLHAPRHDAEDVAPSNLQRGPAILPRRWRFSELAVFYAGLYVQVRRLDEPAERCGVCGPSRSHLHMAHELAGALQQAGRIRQRCAVKEAHVHVRSEYNTLTYPKGASPIHATRQPSCKISRTSSPHFRITSSHSRAIAPNSPPCTFIHASMAGSRSTAPLNRSNSVLTVALLLLSGSMLRGSLPRNERNRSLETRMASATRQLRVVGNPSVTRRTAKDGQGAGCP
jgi:hypothetical protein